MQWKDEEEEYSIAIVRWLCSSNLLLVVVRVTVAERIVIAMRVYGSSASMLRLGGVLADEGIRVRVIWRARYLKYAVRPRDCDYRS